MKTAILSFFIIFSFVSSAQEFTIEKHSVCGVFNCKAETKTALFTSINKSITADNSAQKYQLQSYDLQSGTIVFKGVNEIRTINPSKIIYANNKSVPEYITLKFNHLIEIKVRDGSYTIAYKIIDLDMKDYGFNALFLNCVGFSDSNEKAILLYNAKIEKLYKSLLVGKEKRALLQNTITSGFKVLNSDLILRSKTTIAAVNQSIIGYLAENKMESKSITDGFLVTK